MSNIINSPKKPLTKSKSKIKPEFRWRKLDELCLLNHLIGTNYHFYKEMENLIHKYGLLRSIIIDEDGQILGGEMQLILLRHKPHKIPVFLISNLSPYEKGAIQQIFYYEENNYV